MLDVCQSTHAAVKVSPNDTRTLQCPLHAWENFWDTHIMSSCWQASDKISAMVTYLRIRIKKYFGFPDILIVEWSSHGSRIQRKSCLLLSRMLTPRPFSIKEAPVFPNWCHQYPLSHYRVCLNLMKCCIECRLPGSHGNMQFLTKHLRWSWCGRSLRWCSKEHCTWIWKDSQQAAEGKPQILKAETLR